MDILVIAAFLVEVTLGRAVRFGRHAMGQVLPVIHMNRVTGAMANLL
jgi:hypothetical protein